MAQADIDIGPIESLISFKVDTFEAQHGHAVLLRLRLASTEKGVRTVAVHCGADWATALSGSLSTAAKEQVPPTNPQIEKEPETNADRIDPRTRQHPSR